MGVSRMGCGAAGAASHFVAIALGQSGGRREALAAVWALGAVNLNQFIESNAQGFGQLLDRLD